MAKNINISQEVFYEHLMNKDWDYMKLFVDNYFFEAMDIPVFKRAIETLITVVDKTDKQDLKIKYLIGALLDTNHELVLKYQDEWIQHQISKSEVNDWHEKHEKSVRCFSPLFNSNTEKLVYQCLETVFPNTVVVPNVSLSQLFDFERVKSISPELFSEWRSFLLTSSVDVVIYDKVYYEPLFCIEIDGIHHLQKEIKQKDDLKDKIFDAFGHNALFRIGVNSEMKLDDVIGQIKDVINQENNVY